MNILSSLAAATQLFTTGKYLFLLFSLSKSKACIVFHVVLYTRKYSVSWKYHMGKL